MVFRLVDDNGISTFIDDLGQKPFVDDLGNFTDSTGATTWQGTAILSGAGRFTLLVTRQIDQVRTIYAGGSALIANAIQISAPVQTTVPIAATALEFIIGASYPTVDEVTFTREDISVPGLAA